MISINTYTNKYSCKFQRVLVMKVIFLTGKGKESKQLFEIISKKDETDYY